MILDTILADHKAGRDLFALAGNSTFEGYAERADLFQRFNALWNAHADMMDEAVLPVLAEVTHQTEALDEIRSGQRELRKMIASLAARAADRSNTSDHWFADFHRLKPVYERQVDREDMLVAAMIQHDLKPEQIARMTVAARVMREGRGV
jgi:hypothetical protein